MFKKFFLTALTLVSLSTAALAGPVVGQPAPDFTGTDTAGKTHKLSDFKGKTVVLEWTNPECPYVVKHYGQGNMQKVQKAATDDGVVWLRIISSAPGKQGHTSPEGADTYIKANNVAATATLLDETGTIGKAYDAKTTPHMFVVNAEGTLVYAGAIDDKPTADAADIEGANNHVSAALANLKAGEAVAVAETKPYGCGVKYAD